MTVTNTNSRKLITVGFPVYTLDFTPKKQRVIVGGGGGQGKSGVKNTISVYSLDESTLSVQPLFQTLLPKGDDACMSVAVHPKDKIIVGGVNAAKEKILAGENSNIRVYKFGKEGLSPHRVFQAGASKNEQDYTKRVTFSDDGSLFLAAGTDGKLWLYRYFNTSFKPIFTPIEHSGEIQDADFHRSGLYVASVSAKQLTVAYTSRQEVLKVLMAPKFNKTQSCEFKVCRFGKGVCVDSLFTFLNTTDRKRGIIAIWNVQSLEATDIHPTVKTVTRKPITTAAISEDGRFLAYATSDFSVGVLSTKTLQSVAYLPKAHTFAITSLSFNPTSTVVVSGSADGTIGVWKFPQRGSSGRFLVYFVLLFLALLVVVGGVVLGVVFEVESLEDMGRVYRNFVH